MSVNSFSDCYTDHILIHLELELLLFCMETFEVEHENQVAVTFQIEVLAGAKVTCYGVKLALLKGIPSQNGYLFESVWLGTSLAFTSFRCLKGLEALLSQLFLVSLETSWIFDAVFSFSSLIVSNENAGNSSAGGRLNSLGTSCGG